MSSPLALVGLRHCFARTVALDDVHLELRAGEVHALLGQNGAGKSTLVRCAMGLLRPDEGVIQVDGQPVAFAGPGDAERHGIGMVHQHFSLIEALDVAENLCLGDRGFLLGRRRRRRLAFERMDRHDLHLDPDRRVGSLSVGEKQRLEILRALERADRVLILDEPTASLAPAEIDALFDRLRALRDRGLAVVLITHKLREVFAVADRVSVLDRGRLRFSGPLAETDPSSLRRLLEGERSAPPTRDAPPAPANSGTVALRLEGLRGQGFGPVDLEVCAGSIVGIAGMDGNGQNPLAETLAGLRPPIAGRLERPPQRAYVSADRTHTGLAQGLPISENVLLRRGLLPGPWWSRRRLRERAEPLLRRFDVRYEDIDQPASTLSGGNQQKVVLARELHGDPELVIAEHPTRGLDLASSRQVHAELRAAAAGGAAVVLFSTDLDEVLELSHSIWVADRGQLRATDGTRESVGATMLGAGAV